MENWHWQSEQTRSLLHTFGQRKPPHAYLLTGQEGVGKTTLAKLYTKALLCEAEEPARPCGKCPACIMVSHDNHPDVTVILPGEDPESGGKSNTITIRQIHAAITKMSKTSYYGGFKVLIINKAERMNPAAQNALLKTLEDPPGQCAFFIISKRRGDLLPTIRSRCVLVPVPQLPVATAAKVLINYGMDSKSAQESARFSGGAVGYALLYKDEIEPIARRVRAALDSAYTLSDTPAAAKALTALYDEAKDPPSKVIRANRILEILESILTEALELMNPVCYNTSKGLSLLDRIAAAPPRAILKLMDEIVGARRRLSMFISWASIIDALLYRWLEET